jgi:hypothetical protein
VAELEFIQIKEINKRNVGIERKKVGECSTWVKLKQYLEYTKRKIKGKNIIKKTMMMCKIVRA